ncbi:MAG TPA: DUF362 domain-containing protein [candidate division Zixibacteria bacterium]|nr:DUF362 domain-containing protein [candidate division Zixibacteria bacterium]
MQRRDFIKKTGKAVALATITGGTGLLFHNRIKPDYETVLLKTNSFEVPPEAGLPGITLARSEDHLAAMNAALDAIGGIKRFVKPGERVTVKPNVGWDRTPQQAANTNPELVAEMVRLCLGAGAAEVIVTDVTCNDPRRCFLRSGIRKAAEQAGARVILPGDDDFVKTDLGGELLTVWPVVRYFIDTDRLINMPITKHHSLSSCTIGMKNLYGILGGRRNQLHQQINQSIIDLASFCRPTLTVVDATRVLMRGGPQGGSLDDVAVENSVICSTDQVAADSRALEFLGLTAERVSHIMLAEKNGLGSTDYRSIGYKEVTL